MQEGRVDRGVLRSLRNGKTNKITEDQVALEEEIIRASFLFALPKFEELVLVVVFFLEAAEEDLGAGAALVVFNAAHGNAEVGSFEADGDVR